MAAVELALSRLAALHRHLQGAQDVPEAGAQLALCPTSAAVGTPAFSGLPAPASRARAGAA